MDGFTPATYAEALQTTATDQIPLSREVLTRHAASGYVFGRIGLKKPGADIYASLYYCHYFDMHFPTLQGKDSATFHRPPLDGTLTLPEIFDAHAVNSPNHPLFVFAEQDGNTRDICYPEGVRAIHRAAYIASQHYRRREDKYGAKRKQGYSPVIGILAVSDAISVFSLMMGVMRLGCGVFPISTRNSAVAVAHLISKTGIVQLFVSPDPAMQRLSADAQKILAEGGQEFEILEIPQFEDIYIEGRENTAANSIEKLEMDSPALILHSSGSTAFPKPIKLTHRMLLEWGRLPYHGEVDICGKVLAAHSLPMFHAMGAMNLGWTCCSGMIMACFKPSSPPTIPTPEAFFEGLVRTKSDFAFCVPTFVEHWANNPKNIPTLRAMFAIVYGGAPISKSLGDELVRQGVTLFPFYGLTETGCASMFLPAEKPSLDEWEYFKFSPHMGIRMVPQVGLHGIFESTMLTTETFTPALVTHSIDGRAAYATNDLLLQHPVDPIRWKVYGRADDQLMLSTGEKTNPGPIESILLRDPHIASAIMFGRGRFQNGVLIEPTKEYAFDPMHGDKLAEFRNAIWPSIEKANNFAPAHSRIFKEMIICSKTSKPFEYTAKGTPRRHVALDMYADEIEAAYAAVEDSAQIEIAQPNAWTLQAAKEFVQQAVNNSLGSPVRDGDDIFQHGCDSLQATRIRNTILRALRQSSKASVHEIPYNFVYEHPSIAKLAEFVANLVSMGGYGDSVSVEAKVQEMESLVEKYSMGFKAHHRRSGLATRAEDGEHVLLTGSTGRFGCYLLANLISNSEVARVFACNRAIPGHSLQSRQREAFETWGLDPLMLLSEKLQLLETDISQSDLGLEQQMFEEIHSSVTSVIHNAWRVDFNLALSSFEPFIVGVRNLIDLSLSSWRDEPPKIIFTSSIAVSRGHRSEEPTSFPETSISDPRVAVGTGYSEGKWVAERILEKASEATTTRTAIVRVGQLSGDSMNGAWNKKEWVPAMVRAGQIIGCLPLRQEDVAWVPADLAASALLELRHANAQFFHLVHPMPVKWSTVLEPVARALDLPLIPYQEWVKRLEAHMSQPHDADPALVLLEFFRAGAAEGQWMPPHLDTENAGKASPTLTHLNRLGSQSAENWVAYWRSIGFLA